MAVFTLDSAVAANGAPVIRTIDGRDLDGALWNGLRDLIEMREELAFIGLFYPLFGLIAIILGANASNALLLSDSLRPMVFPAVAGVALLGPAIACGFCELAHRQASGLDSGWLHFLDPVRGANRLQLSLLTLALVLLFLAWLLCADLIYGATLGASGDPHGLGVFLHHLFGTSQGWALILIGNLVGFCFAVVVLTLGIVAFPMIIDRQVDACTAILTSARVFARNPLAVLAWGGRVAGLLVLGCLPLFMGLAVVLPVLGYANWHLYTRLVED